MAQSELQSRAQTEGRWERCGHAGCARGAAVSVTDMSRCVRVDTLKYSSKWPRGSLAEQVAYIHTACCVTDDKAGYIMCGAQSNMKMRDPLFTRRKAFLPFYRDSVFLLIWEGVFVLFFKWFYLFMAALGLRCYMGFSLAEVLEFLTAVASLVAEHGL